MNQDLQQKNIIITSVETLDWGVKITDEKGLKYNIPQFKKGTETQTAAYITLSALPKMGLNLNKCFKFVSVQNNQGGQSRYVRIITEPADEQGKTNYISPVMQNNKEIKVEKEDDKWEKINEKKTDDIRTNVALKMVSEIIASGKIDINDWEEWTNKFYNYKPNTNTKEENSEPEIEPPF